MRARLIGKDDALTRQLPPRQSPQSERQENRLFVAGGSSHQRPVESDTTHTKALALTHAARGGRAAMRQEGHLHDARNILYIDRHPLQPPQRRLPSAGSTAPALVTHSTLIRSPPRVSASSSSSCHPPWQALNRTTNPRHPKPPCLKQLQNNSMPLRRPSRLRNRPPAKKRSRYRKTNLPSQCPPVPNQMMPAVRRQNTTEVCMCSLSPSEAITIG